MHMLPPSPTPHPTPRIQSLIQEFVDGRICNILCFKIRSGWFNFHKSTKHKQKAFVKNLLAGICRYMRKMEPTFKCFKSEMFFCCFVVVGFGGGNGCGCGCLFCFVSLPMWNTLSKNPNKMSDLRNFQVKETPFTHYSLESRCAGTFSLPSLLAKILNENKRNPCDFRQGL